MGSKISNITDFECDVCEWICRRVQAPFDPLLDRCYKCQNEEGFPGESEAHEVPRTKRTCSVCPETYWCTDYQYELFDRRCYTCFHKYRLLARKKAEDANGLSTFAARFDMLRARKHLRDIHDHIQGLGALDTVAGAAMNKDQRDLLNSTKKALQNGYDALHAAISRLDDSVNEVNRTIDALKQSPVEEKEAVELDATAAIADTSESVSRGIEHHMGYTSPQVCSIVSLVAVTRDGREVFRVPVDIDPGQHVRVVIELQDA